MRFRALGRDYVPYLTRGLLRWATVWGACCGVFVLARWALRRDVLISRRAAVALALAPLFGVAIRLLQELFPREIWIEGQTLYVHKSNWSSLPYPLTEDAPLYLTLVGDKLVRVNILCAKGTRRVTFGLRPDDAKIFANVIEGLRVDRPS